MRNNTFEIPAVVAPERGIDSIWTGNLGSWDCRPGITYRGNVGERCSDGDRAISPASSNATTTAAFGWRDPARHDFRLDAGSPAIDRGDQTDFPATDRDGKPRVAGSVDAGAYER